MFMVKGHKGEQNLKGHKTEFSKIMETCEKNKFIHFTATLSFKCFLS